jgi:hypothetical protein
VLEFVVPGEDVVVLQSPGFLVSVSQGDEPQTIAATTSFRFDGYRPLSAELWNDGQMVAQKIIPGGQPDKMHQVALCFTQPDRLPSALHLVA